MGDVSLSLWALLMGESKTGMTTARGLMQTVVTTYRNKEEKNG